VALVGTDVSEELSASFIRVTRIGELGTTLAVTSNRRTLVLVVIMFWIAQDFNNKNVPNQQLEGQLIRITCSQFSAFENKIPVLFLRTF
jgi:hypothetical protein